MNLLSPSVYLNELDRCSMSPRCVFYREEKWQQKENCLTTSLPHTWTHTHMLGQMPHIFSADIDRSGKQHEMKSVGEVCMYVYVCVSAPIYRQSQGQAVSCRQTAATMSPTYPLSLFLLLYNSCRYGRHPHPFSMPMHIPTAIRMNYLCWKTQSLHVHM